MTELQSDSFLPPDLATPPYRPTEQERQWLPHGWKNATGESVRCLVVALRANPQFRTAAVRLEPVTSKAQPISLAKRQVRAALPVKEALL